MRAFFLVLFVVFTGVALSQEAIEYQIGIVTAADGFATVRTEPSKDSEKAGNLAAGSFVYCLEPAGDWYEITYVRDHKPCPGFIHRSDVRFLSEYPRLEPAIVPGCSFACSLPSITVCVTIKDFDPAGHQLEYIAPVTRLHVARYLDKIDGSTFWGTDGEVPTRMYGEIIVTCRGERFTLPGEAIANLFQPNPGQGHMDARYDSAAETLYLTAVNGDGAGGYVVLWVVQHGKYLERFVVPGF